MWIKLKAKTEKDKILYINTDKITLIEELNIGGSQLIFEQPDFWANVKETPEEILEMLK